MPVDKSEPAGCSGPPVGRTPGRPDWEGGSALSRPPFSLGPNAGALPGLLEQSVVLMLALRHRPLFAKPARLPPSKGCHGPLQVRKMAGSGAPGATSGYCSAYPPMTPRLGGYSHF